MKKILCYFGIIVLLGLVLFPPILRIVLPNKEEDNKNEVIERIILSCSNQEYIANSSYDNDKITMIIIKKLNVSSDRETEFYQNQLNELTDTTLTGNELKELFESLKDKSTVVHNVLDDGEVISIDFSLSDNKELNLTSLTKNVQEQKNFYESQKLNCMIKK